MKNRGGRPPVSVPDIVYCFCLRTLTGTSGLLADTYVREAFSDGLISYKKPPSEPTITRRIRQDEDVLLAFHRGITKTSLLARESPDRRFYTDASEFQIPNKDPHDPEAAEDRELSIKEMPAPKRRTPLITIEEQIVQKRTRQKDETKTITGNTVKLQVLVHHETKLAVAAHVTYGKANEGPQLSALLDRARENHTLGMVAADKGYWSDENLRYGERNNIRILIPPKSNSKSNPNGSLMEQYTFRWFAEASTMPKEYRIRANAEGFFSGTKRVHDDDVRSRTFAAQTIEVLSMVLMRNLFVLVERYIEYGDDIPWLDKESRIILDRAKELVKDRPPVDKSARYHDGLGETSES
jgi:hypothetical protein